MPEEPEELFCPALTKAVLYQIRKPDEVIMEHDDRFKVVLHSFSSDIISLALMLAPFRNTDAHPTQQRYLIPLFNTLLTTG